MKVTLSRSDAQKKIDDFFKKDSFSSAEMRKIKRLAMKYNIKLADYRKKFCKKCLCKLKGKIKVSKTHKTIECSNCRYKNRFRINYIKTRSLTLVS